MFMLFQMMPMVAEVGLAAAGAAVPRLGDQAKATQAATSHLEHKREVAQCQRGFCYAIGVIRHRLANVCCH
jgi:hypothetical protein